MVKKSIMILSMLVVGIVACKSINSSTNVLGGVRTEEYSNILGDCMILE